MDNLINKFILQLEEAIIISDNSSISPHSSDLNKVFISGMGGSGIAGRFTSEIMKLYGVSPVITSNCYEIPNWIDKNTLAIVSSYSGNTEETLSAYNKLLDKGAKVVAITSGGKLYDSAINKSIDLIKLPDDWPAPRACFGYSFIAQLYVLFKLDLLRLELSKELSMVIDLLLRERESIKIEAEEIGKRLIDKLPVIYSDSVLEPVSIRFRQQLNENSKTLAFHATFPEMNHNELVGWNSYYKDLAVVIFKAPYFSERINSRINLSKEIIVKYVDTMIEVDSKGDRVLQHMIYLVHLADWISWFLAQKKGVDAMEIANIDFLKSELAKL